MPGFLIGFAAICLFCLLYTDRTAERTLTRVCGAESRGHAALSRALEVATGRYRTTPDQALDLPQILVFPDPIPQAWLIRSIGRAGRILISQGLISTLTESELRTVFQFCYLRIRERGIPWRTACAAWNARLIHSLRKRPWTPATALMGWVLYPWVKSLARQSRGLDVFQVPPTVEDARANEIWFNALQKVTRIRLIHGTGDTFSSVSTRSSFAI